jgi:hypothetical protein
MLFEQSCTFPLFNKRKICGIGLILQEFVCDAAFFFASWFYNAQQKDLSSATLSGKAARRATTRKVVLDIGEKRNRYDDRIYRLL